MKIVKEGDKNKAVCQFCGLQSITYALRDVPFSDNNGVVRNILAGICDKCDNVVSIPRQSTPKIKAAYNEVKRSAEYRVPAHFIDILSLMHSQKVRANFQNLISGKIDFQISRTAGDLP